MSRIIHVLLVICLVGSSSIRKGYCQVDDPKLAAVDLLFEAYNATTPGIHAIAMVGDSVIVSKGYGMENMEENLPISDSSLFDIGSIAKPITAYGIYLLVQEKSLALNDKIKRYLPDLPAVMDDIEIQHFLYHTSGVRDWTGFLPLAGKSLTADIDLELIYHYVKKQEKLNFKPGDEFLYSNTGYNLLALIIESVTKQPYELWIRENVFLPLGMDGASCFTANENIAKDYFKTAKGYKQIATNLQAYGSSSVVMQPKDMLQWLSFFQATKKENPDLYALWSTKGELTSGTNMPYGLGVDVISYKDLLTLGHGGAWAGFRSHFIYVPEHDLSVAVLCNTNRVIALDKCHQLLDIFLPEKASGKVETSSNTKELLTDVERISGVYKRGLGKYIFIEEKNNVPHIAVSGEDFYPMELVEGASFWIPAYKAGIQFFADEDKMLVAQYKGLECPKVTTSITLSNALKSKLTGEYYSSELDTKCSIFLKDNELIFETSNQKEIPLAHAYNLEFTGNRLWIEVVEFLVIDDIVVGLEVSELRSRDQYFKKI